MRKLYVHGLIGTPTILCVWCGSEVPCVGHTPTKCPYCGHNL